MRQRRLTRGVLWALLALFVAATSGTPARADTTEYDPNNPTHGGTIYSGNVPTCRVLTVGYSHSSPNEFDFATIQDALNLTADNLLYRDGTEYPYLGSSPDLIRISAGTYNGSLQSATGWWVLRADGEVTIRGGSSDAQVLSAPPPSGGNLLSIGGTHQAGGFSGTITVRPYVNAQGQVSTNQRAITCGMSGQTAARLELVGTSFIGFRSGGPGGAILDFKGYAANCTFTDCRSTGDGGAVCGRGTAGSECDFIDCTFTDCQATGTGADGGALFGVDQVGALGSQETGNGCTFTDCVAAANGGAVSTATDVIGSIVDGCSAGGLGGGLHNITARIGRSASLVGGVSALGSCEITDCTAAEGGGAADCDAVVTGCAFDRNVATGAGGGGVSGIDGDINRCRFACNEATSTQSTMGRGGAIRQSGGKILNCLIIANVAEGHGGGISNSDSAIKHCTIVQNQSGDLGGGLRGCDGGIRNCIIVDNLDANGGPNSCQVSDCAEIQFCCLPTGWSGNGSHLVRTNDVGFEDYTGTDPLAWDLRLTATSPCIDQGNDQTSITDNYFGTARPVSTQWDIGADERQ